MRLVTWNLDGLGRLHVDVRTEAAVFLAVTGRTLGQLGKGQRPAVPAPDVLLLQEVTGHTFRAHLRPHLTAAGYVLDVRTPPEREEFEVVAVRQPARIVAASIEPLRLSRLGRELHVVDIDGVAGMAGPVRVLTAHFDSGPQQSEVRVDALRQVSEAMDERSVFGGDANLREVEWDEVAGAVALTDAWEAVGEPEAVRSTWRMGERAARFDRVWVGTGLQATSMTAVGKARLSTAVGPPSDHIGLRVEISDPVTRASNARQLGGQWRGKVTIIGDIVGPDPEITALFEGDADGE